MLLLVVGCFGALPGEHLPAPTGDRARDHMGEPHGDNMHFGNVAGGRCWLLRFPAKIRSKKMADPRFIESAFLWHGT